MFIFKPIWMILAEGISRFVSWQAIFGSASARVGIMKLRMSTTCNLGPERICLYTWRDHPELKVPERTAYRVL